MPFSFFSRKKPSRRFNDFYDDWFKTLTENCLPLLRQSLSSAASASVLSSNVDLVLRHLVLYYETLDLAADHNTIPYLLFPSWRNSLETPFLFLGDIHPYLLTNLLRSFIDRENQDSDDDGDTSLDLVNQPLKISTAWKDPSDELVKRIDQIECTMRLMVPGLMDRMRKAQRGFVARVSENWVLSYQVGKKKKLAATVATASVAVDEAAKGEMEELVSIFVDANRLRKSVIMDIVGATSEHQAALFLEGLCQFLAGFKDQVLLQDSEILALPS
ncbi:PREDICTED: protein INAPERTURATE POLLEN1-like [Camelina sativa]|uniref:Protein INAPERTURATE POLLEN1-like n=1 Tax=Camelina sativa TaxID=90675 RepID=A0ABM0V082_CAMSA|nr:PREDICTED: protein INAPERTURATE POLLEN1-like [Camelina sativa]